MQSYQELTKDLDLLSKIGLWAMAAIGVFVVLSLLEVLFGLFVEFCEAVNHRIKYGPGVVLEQVATSDEPEETL